MMCWYRTLRTLSFIFFNSSLIWSSKVNTCSNSFSRVFYPPRVTKININVGDLDSSTFIISNFNSLCFDKFLSIGSLLLIYLFGHLKSNSVRLFKLFVCRVLVFSHDFLKERFFDAFRPKQSVERDICCHYYQDSKDPYYDIEVKDRGQSMLIYHTAVFCVE